MNISIVDFMFFVQKFEKFEILTLFKILYRTQNVEFIISKFQVPSFQFKV